MVHRITENISSKACLYAVHPPLLQHNNKHETNSAGEGRRLWVMCSPMKDSSRIQTQAGTHTRIGNHPTCMLCASGPANSYVKPVSLDIRMFLIPIATSCTCTGCAGGENQPTNDKKPILNSKHRSRGTGQLSSALFIIPSACVVKCPRKPRDTR